VSFQLTFSRSHDYDAGQAGITIPVKLKLSAQSAEFNAKLDTGATDCIFARRFGEKLNLEIESGEKIRISTATGLLTAYGHELTMSVLDFEFDAFVFFVEEEAFDRSVLGRRAFLDQMIIGLVDYEGKLYLNRYQYNDADET
jgi:hypothetical protein